MVYLIKCCINIKLKSGNLKEFLKLITLQLRKDNNIQFFLLLYISVSHYDHQMSRSDISFYNVTMTL